MLNPQLYEALEKEFGNVGIVNENEQGTYTCSTRVTNFKKAGAKPKKTVYADVIEWGEVYKVNCPVCGDTRSRLYFSHLWGTKIRSGRKEICFSRRLYFCHNERCILVNHLNGLTELKLELDPTNVPSKTKEVPLVQELELPKGLIPLNSDDVPLSVIAYLAGRDFNLEELHRLYHVMFAPKGTVWKEATDTEPAKEFYEDRIIIPIINGRRIVSWQARRTRDSGKEKFKYINPSGGHQHSYIYNMDAAWHYKDIVIVEGITDVWRIGLHSIDIFGKTVSKEQVFILKTLWGHIGRCCVCLDSSQEDPDTDEKSAKLVKQLVDSKAFPRGVVELRLETGDPGSHSREEINGLIKGTLNGN